MRLALLLLLFCTLAAVPTRSQADPTPPKAVLLACDTLSANPLQIHLQFGLQDPPDGVICTRFIFAPQNAATHILSCSTTYPGATCSTSGGGATWDLHTCIAGAQSIGTFDFVTDQSPACFVAL